MIEFFQIQSCRNRATLLSYQNCLLWGGGGGGLRWLRHIHGGGDACSEVKGAGVELGGRRRL